MKIGENDYTPPFWWDSTDEGWFIADSFGKKEEDDCEGDQVDVNDILAGLNELATLRAENAELKKRIEDLEVERKVLVMKVDPRIVRVEFTSGDFHMLKLYTRIELRHSQSFPRVEADFVKFCQESETKGGE